MKLFLSLLAFLVAPSSSRAEMTTFVGIRNIRVQDQAKEISFPVLVMYPTQVPSNAVSFGPYSLNFSPDAPVEGRALPIVVLSHGNGSTPLVYRTIAHS